jgi:LPXTG-motif cell wall-anchored protein
VTNFFTGSLPLTGSELSVAALWIGVAVLGVGLALVLLRFVRRRRLR